MKQVTATHFIPLIGPFIGAIEKLNLNDGYNVKNAYIFSFPGFAANEQHINPNYGETVTYLPVEILPDYDNDPKWFSVDTYKNYIKENGIKSTNLTLAVPPCAGLSMLNCSNRGSDCARNNWMYETIKWHIAQDNDVLLLENAPGLLGREGINVIENIKMVIAQNVPNPSEYKIHLTKTTTTSHGIPQYRGRTFLLMYKKSKHQIFKNILHQTPLLENFLNRPAAYDATIQHVPIEYKYEERFLDMIKKKGILQKFKTTHKDKEYVTDSAWHLILDEYMKDPTYLDGEFESFKREANKNVSKLKMGKGYWDASPLFVKGRTTAVISKNSHRTIHPKFDRYLSIRELMDLMGLKNGFMLQGNPSKNFNHICQNVPVFTAADHLKWAIAIILQDEHLLGELDIGSEILMQNNMKQDLQNDLNILNWKTRSFDKIKKNETSMDLF